MTLGSNIQKIRKEAHLSQEALAEMFNVTRQTISNWENSKSYPDLETIIKISDSFEISLDILLKEDMTMIKTMDNEVKNTRKYARALLAIGIMAALIIGSFAIYSMVYYNTKTKLENNFEKQLKDNAFYKNRDGYYSMNYAKGVVYGVPNQSMPDLLDFTLHFDDAELYCDVDYEDVTVQIIWDDKNTYYASAVSKDNSDIIVGSTSEFTKSDLVDMNTLGKELCLPEEYMREIINKGNELYRDFY